MEISVAEEKNTFSLVVQYGTKQLIFACILLMTSFHIMLEIIELFLMRKFDRCSFRLNSGKLDFCSLK